MPIVVEGANPYAETAALIGRLPDIEQNAREAQALTVKQVAAKVGISSDTLANFEAGSNCTKATVVGYEGRYDVSDQGRIRSYAKGKVAIRPTANHGAGYRSIRLFDGEYRTRMVHHLVLEAFVGPRPTPQHETAHANHDRSDNRAVNLRWATKSENTMDKVISGRAKELGGRKCLNAEQVREIRAKAESGHGLKAIAELYGVSSVTVWQIQNRKTWAHI